MKVKLDENLGRLGAEQLRAAGIDVATVRDQGLTSCSDETVLEVARIEDRCLLSLDLDFSNPIVYPPHRFAGVVVFRLPEPFETAHLERAIEMFLAAAKEQSLAKRLWIVELNRVREYMDDGSDEHG